MLAKTIGRDRFAGRFSALACLAALFACVSGAVPAAPVLFATQTPFGGDFANIGSVFANHRGDVQSAPRGGDLYIRYDDGTLRNLTLELGFGVAAGQHIAVREPHVHWDGQKALFSMVIGGTTQDNYAPVYFQIYEIANLGQLETPTIQKLPQLEDFNNVSPIYGTDDRIIFTSDRPRNGSRTLYPQLDEYESTPTVSGVWSMNADGSDLKILDHAPSGAFRPTVDSAGRLLFARWDHLQRDQQADSDIDDILNGNPNPGYGIITFDSEESENFHALAPGDEIFPEVRALSGPGGTPHPQWDFDHQPGERDHRFNHFFPWAMNEDGTEAELLLHLGRHEMFNYIQSARDHLPDQSLSGRPRDIRGFLTPVEDPTRPGYLYAIDAPEFQTHAAGQVIGVFAPAGMNADDAIFDYVTHRETSVPESPGSHDPNHSGLYRDPMARADGTVWAAHTATTIPDSSTVPDPGPPNAVPLSSRYDFAIKKLEPVSGQSILTAGERLVAGGINDSVTYFDNFRYRTVTYTGPMWELYPVELVARPRPAKRSTPLPAIEQNIMLQELGSEGMIQALRDYLVANELALIVSRDVTRRADKQQEYNLKIAWSDHQTAEQGATPEEIGWMQFFEGKQVRGLFNDPDRGRRVLARPMSDDLNPPQTGGPVGSVRLGDDGSMAAFVPARRALSWQSTQPDGGPVVRERYWLTFQPGEMRSCVNCHGINREDVFANPPPTNEPEALRDLLQWWLAENGPTADSTGWLTR
jgi:hypothetical protein